MYIYITNILMKSTEKSPHFFGLQNSGIILPDCSNVTSVVHAMRDIHYAQDVRLPCTVTHTFSSHTFMLIIKILRHSRKMILEIAKTSVSTQQLYFQRLIKKTTTKYLSLYVDWNSLQLLQLKMNMRQIKWIFNWRIQFQLNLIPTNDHVRLCQLLFLPTYSSILQYPHD